MKATWLFVVHSIAAALFGIGFVFFPAFMTEFLGLPTNPAGLLGWRFFGLGILTIAIIAYGSRNEQVADVRWPVMVAFLFAFVAMALLKVILVAFAGWQFNLWAWSVVGFHAVMAVLYGYYVFRR